MANHEVTTGEIMEYLKEHMVTKDDLKAHPTRDEMLEMESRLITVIDSIGKTVETHDQELTVLRHRVDKLAGQAA